MKDTLELVLDGFDERTAWEVAQKGFLELAKVRFPDGKIAKVCFWDPIRLSADCNSEAYGRKHESGGERAVQKWVLRAA
jgi:hypothetical protein